MKNKATNPAFLTNVFRILDNKWKPPSTLVVFMSQE
jgi:hypothetical protein